MTGRPQGMTTPHTWSLATRLTMWYACSAFALILMTTVFLYRSLVRNLDREEELFLADRIQDVRDLLKDQPENSVGLSQEVAENSRYVQVYVRVLTERGQTIVETPGMDQLLAPSSFPQPASADADPGRGTNMVSLHGQSFRGLAARGTMGPAGDGARVIQAALSQAKKQGLLTKYRKRLWRVLGIALFACAVISYQIARRGIRPVWQISQAVQHVRSSSLDQRIPTRGLPAELLTMANIFNNMLARLEESFARLSQFSANIAHELRTPVNNLRGMTEVALRSVRSPEEYRDTLGSCLEECVRLSRLIESLLFLARAEQARLPIQQESLNIAEELRIVSEFYEAVATEAGVTLILDAQRGLVTSLDRPLFQRALGNLITNAITHTPKGGTVTLAAAKTPDGICVEVLDTGCGIPSEQLPYVFDRFYQAHPVGVSVESKGTGLGLAIVKSIVTLHGGSTTIASEVGQGTRVKMLFPASPL